MSIIISIGGKPSVQRDAKGNNLAIVCKDYVVLDIETTGLDTRYDEIIELAAMRIRAGKQQDVFQSLIKPRHEIDDFISELTGITNEMVENAPKIHDALPNFLEFIGNDIVVGHNVHFDINFIYDNTLRTMDKPFSNDFIDTMRLARKVFPNMPNHKLTTLAKQLNLSATPTHRALNDCNTTLDLYCTILEQLQKDNVNIEELFKKKYTLASSIVATKTDFDESHPLFGKHCVFTGALEKMLRNDAMQLVVDLGGNCSSNVNKKTNYLILGNHDYCSNIKDGKSNKIKKAEELILKGQDLEIISENVFYDLIETD